jgi:hypothetical protein
MYVVQIIEKLSVLPGSFESEFRNLKERATSPCVDLERVGA